LEEAKKLLVDDIAQIKNLPNNTGLIIYADVDPA
jgi:hypothetical protein